VSYKAKPTTPPPTTLFNEDLLRRNRLWAKPCFEPTLFKAAAKRIIARLEPLKLPFTRILDLSPFHTPGLERWIHKTRPTSSVVRDDGYAFGEKAFDLILSPLQLHWTNDPQAYLAAIFEALAPGGLFIANFWGGNTLVELRHVLAELDFELFGTTFQRLIPLMRLEDANRLLASCPFHLGVADQDNLTFCYKNVNELCTHLKRTGEGLALSERTLPPFSKHFWKKADTRYRHSYTYVKTLLSSKKSHKPYTKAKKLTHDPDYPIPATFSLITLTGWKDGPDIPRALKPFSGKKDLNAVLNDSALKDLTRT